MATTVSFLVRPLDLGESLFYTRYVILVTLSPSPFAPPSPSPLSSPPLLSEPKVRERVREAVYSDGMSCVCIIKVYSHSEF